MSETAILSQHSNPHIAAFHDRVQNEPTLSSHTETDRSRIAAAACVECQKTGKDISGMTEVECYEHKGKAMFLANDPVKAARNPYTILVLVNIDQAVQTPVQDSLHQMQAVQNQQAQALAQSQAQSGPVIS